MHYVGANADHGEQQRRPNPLDNVVDGCEFDCRVEDCRGILPRQLFAVMERACSLATNIGEDVARRHAAHKADAVVAADDDAEQYILLVDEVRDHERLEVVEPFLDFLLYFGLVLGM